MGTPPTTSTTQPYALSSRSPYQSYHNPTMAINPAFVHSFSPPQQNTQSPPRTLSPYVLHAPSPPVETISPTAFYQQSTPSTSTTPPSNAPTPTFNKLTSQARQERFNSTIRPLLQPHQFTGAGAVSDLADKIISLDISEIEGPLRLEILTKIRDNAGNHYFRAWVENEDAMDITREWLKAAAKGDDQLAETIMPLLHVRRSFIISMMDVPECRNRQIIDRLPWSLESLRKAKLGKIILKLTKEASISGKYLSAFLCLCNCNPAAVWLPILSPARCTCTFPHIVRKETNELESNNSLLPVRIASQRSRTWHRIWNVNGDRWRPPTRKMMLQKRVATQKLQRVGHVSSLYCFAHVTDAVSGNHCARFKNEEEETIRTSSKTRSPSEEDSGYTHNGKNHDSYHEGWCGQGRQVRFIVLLYAKAEAKASKLQEGPCPCEERT